jgi:homoserine dehydrogenase
MTRSQNDPIRVGFLGFGIVGGGTAEILNAHASDIERRVGTRVEVARVAVRSLSKQRTIELDPGIVTTDPWEVVGDPTVQIVVEVIGGIEPDEGVARR